MKKFKINLILLVLLVASLGLLGWFKNWVILTSISSKYFPIAPLTAILFIVLSFNYLLYFLKKPSKVVKRINLILPIISLLISVFCLIDYFFILNWDFEEHLFNKSYLFGENPVGEISPLAASLFIFSNIFFLTIKNKKHKITHSINSIFFYLQAFSSAIFLLGYVKNSMFIYTFDILSLSIPTAFAFFLISLVQLNIMEFKIWPLKKLFHSSTIQTKLLKSFLPFILIFILTVNYIESHILTNKPSGTINNSIFFLIIIITIIVIYAFISRKIGNELNESKTLYQRLFNNSTVGLYQTTPKGKVISANPTLIKMFEYNCLEDLLKSDLSTGSYVDVSKKIEFDSIMKKNGEIADYRSERYTKNQKIITVLEGAKAVKDINGEIIRYDGVIENITNFKNTLEKLKLSDERFRLASLATNEVIWERDLINKTYWRSNNFATIFGWKNKEFGYSDEDIKKGIHPDDLKRVSSKIYDYFESKENHWEDEYRILQKDGTYAWVYDRAYKLNDSNGNPIKVIGSMSNITQKYLQEQKLKDSEEKYRNIVNNAFIGVFETDLNGKLLFSNKFLQEESGYNELTKSDNIFINDRYSNKSQREQLIKKVKSKGFVTNYEVDFITKNDKLKHCLINVKITTENKLVGMILDITDKKKFENELLKLSHAIEQSPVSVMITNRNGILEYCNPKVSNVTGYSYNELIGENPSILSSKEKKEEEYKELWETIKSGKNWHGEFHNKKKNGEFFWEKASISPVYDSKGTITHYIAIKEDITEQKEILRQLTIAKNKAEESDRLKSAFLANMSHEIRTPMNGILGFSELLKTPNLTPEKQHKYIEIIEKSGLRMLNTINDIIDISKIEANLVKVTTTEITINKTLNDLYLFFLPQAVKKGIILTNLNEFSSDLIFKSDHDKIYSILQNLIKNAIKFTFKGSIVFGYEIINESLIFNITDTGIGVPLNKQQHIFERFVQADIEDVNVFEGSGLGLSISKHYAKMLNGDLSVTSIEGKGSNFQLTIPIIQLNLNNNVKINNSKSIENNIVN
ncbi:PAS domain S-box protein [Lutibacter citreus]|uniref:PAS domain S-box protein n=1 Tax=Lutibacter citreus TaxID=2138210 RepID=UPI000DBE2902|nr:PAS domain S-box protein [Lutibacter citreus]